MQILFRRLTHIHKAQVELQNEIFRNMGRIILDYFDNQWPSAALTSDQQQQARACQSDIDRRRLYQNLIFKELRLLNLTEKQKLLNVIDDAFHYYTSPRQPLVEKRIVCLKQAITQRQYQNWKDAMLESKHTKQVNLHFFKSRFDTDLMKDDVLENDARFTQVTVKQATVTTSAVTGSTFITNDSRILEGSQNKDRYCLDAIYSSTVADENTGEIVGSIVAAADGCGGHKEEHEDEVIGKLSHFAVKHAARLTAGYHTPDELGRNLHHIVDLVSSEIANKQGRANRGTQTTLVFGRSFRLEDGNHRFLGANVGDSMVSAWDPKTKQFITISPGFPNGGLCLFTHGH